MAKYFDPNFLTGTEGSGQIFKLKTFLQTAGWICWGSCDGVTAGSGDHVDRIGSVAEMGANGAWIVLTDPTTTKQLLFGHRIASVTTWYVAYSRGALYVGGSTGAYPTATDSGDMCGSSATATILFNAAATRTHYYADSVTGAFYMIVCKQATGLDYTLIYVDPLLNGVDGDTDQYSVGAIYQYSSGAFYSSGFYSESNSTTYREQGSQAWYDLTGTPTFQPHGALKITAYYRGFPYDGSGGMATNLSDGKDPVMPVIYARSTYQAAPGGYKGVSSLFEMLGTGRAPGDTLSQAATMDRVVFGTWRTTLPWDGSTIPIV